MRSKLLNGLYFFIMCFLSLNSAFGLSNDVNTNQALCLSINCKNMISFLNTLESSIKNNVKTKVADLMSYPLTINTTRQDKAFTYKIKNKREFIENYEFIITNNMKKYILNTGLDSIINNYQGIGICNGIFWLIDDDPPIKISVVNVY